MTVQELVKAGKLVGGGVEHAKAVRKHATADHLVGGGGDGTASADDLSVVWQCAGVLVASGGEPLRDTRVDQVEAQRWRCRACGRTFRVYPVGVSARQGSQRLFGAAIMLYLLGLSYGAVALALRALGHPLAKTTVYYAVQAAAERVPGLKRGA